MSLVSKHFLPLYADAWSDPNVWKDGGAFPTRAVVGRVNSISAFIDVNKETTAELVRLAEGANKVRRVTPPLNTQEQRHHYTR